MAIEINMCKEYVAAVWDVHFSHTLGGGCDAPWWC